MSDFTTRKGKIARLPKTIRDQINGRLADNQPASVILPWLNALEAVRAILSEHFGGDLVNDQNLSAWRTGGFAEWMTKNDQVERTRSKAAHALELVKAGGHHLTDGMAAIIAGELLEEWEQASDEDEKESAIKKLLALRAGDHVVASLALQQQKLQLDEDKHGLNVNKFRTLTVKKFMEWCQDPRAQSILNSGKPKDVQMDMLHELIWGEKPKGGDE